VNELWSLRLTEGNYRLYYVSKVAELRQ
jgi:hypothetical protein